jgi:hypothetical protein
MNSTGGGSGWTSFTKYPGRPHVARYSRTFSTNLPSSISLNVGCGGTPQKWGSSSSTPAKKVTSGAILFMNARCTPSAGTCGFPPLENDTPKAPSFNPATQYGTDECTYRASEFWKTMTGRFPNWPGNAGFWDTNAAATGWRVEGVPMADSIAILTQGDPGHVGYVADTRVSSGKLQMKIYDRNKINDGKDINGQWRDYTSAMRFIVAPPQTEATVR